MTGIVIASPASREVFRDVFEGSEIQPTWLDSPEVFVATAGPDFVLDLDFLPDPRRIAALDAIPAPLILINAVATTLRALDPRYVRINAWNTFLQRPLAEVVVRHSDMMTQVTAMCTAWGKIPEFLPDLPGMPSARIVAMIINEAYLAWGEGVSTKEAIDTAMRLGTNYPRGPFEWGRQIGLTSICRLLGALAIENPLYSIAPPLREEALAHGHIA